MTRRFAPATVTQALMLALTCAWSAGGLGCNRAAPWPAMPADASIGSYPASATGDCLPDVVLIDQYGRRVSLASLKGRPILIDFIYTDCTTACPLMTAKLAAVAKLLGPKARAAVMFVSLTINPEQDSSADLLRYALSHDANNSHWLFLTGAPIDVVNLLRTFGLRREHNDDGTISHAANCFLIGPDGRQLRVYDAVHVPAETVAADAARASARG